MEKGANFENLAAVGQCASSHAATKIPIHESIVCLNLGERSRFCFPTLLFPDSSVSLRHRINIMNLLSPNLGVQPKAYVRKKLMLGVPCNMQ